MTVARAVPGRVEWGELAAPHLARYLFAAEWVRGKRVLDAGTGSGYGAALLAHAGAAGVVGIDNDTDTITQAQQTYLAPGLTFAVDDCETLANVAGRFDVICSFENIEHLHHPDKFLESAGRCLQPEGTLLISSRNRAVTPPFRYGKPCNPYHHHEWYREEFDTLLTRWFEDVEIRVQVVTNAQQARIEAVAALRQGLTWSNPLALLLWRKWPFAGPKSARGWKKLAGLAASSPGDYPIVTLVLAPLLGTPWFHIAVCRRPRIAAEPLNLVAGSDDGH